MLLEGWNSKITGSDFVASVLSFYEPKNLKRKEKKEKRRSKIISILRQKRKNEKKKV